MNYKENPHNTTHNHPKLNVHELGVLLSLYENKVHRNLARLYYGEGYTLERCSELMGYSKRHIERMKQEIDKTAFYSLLNMVINSKNALKLSKIRNIIVGGEDN